MVQKYNLSAVNHHLPPAVSTMCPSQTKLSSGTDMPPPPLPPLIPTNIWAASSQAATGHISATQVLVQLGNQLSKSSAPHHKSLHVLQHFAKKQKSWIISVVIVQSHKIMHPAYRDHAKAMHKPGDASRRKVTNTKNRQCLLEVCAYAQMVMPNSTHMGTDGCVPACRWQRVTPGTCPFSCISLSIISPR
jgi:hypothetical protein